MTVSWRFSGIYDLRTLKHLRDIKVNHFVFDLRPKSFSFIQEHLLIDVLKELPFGTVYLLFNNEKDFVIERLVSECRKVFGGPIFLEFDGAFNQQAVEHLNVGFFQHINDHQLDEPGLNHRLCQGHVFDFKLLNEIFEDQKMTSFVNGYYSLFAQQSLSLKQVLSIDWDSNLFSSLFDYFDFDCLTLPINNKVEVCYRNVDLNKVSSQLSLLNRNL